MVSPAGEKTTPLAAVRRHLLVSALLVLLLTGASVLWAVSQDRTYGAETRLAVAGKSLSAEAVAGFALASQELAANYSRYVNNAEEQSTLEADLGVPDGSVLDVTASPIPESNVLRIEVEATDPEVALAAVTQISTSLQAQVNDSEEAAQTTADALAQYTQLSQQVADAQQASAAAQNAVDAAVGRVTAGFPRSGDDLPALRQVAADAAAQLATLEVQQEALGDRYQSLVNDAGTASNLNVAEAPTSTGSDLVARVERFGVLGAAVGIALAFLVAPWLERRRRRARPAAATASPSTPSTPDQVASAGATAAPVDTARVEVAPPAGAAEPRHLTDSVAVNGDLRN